MSSIIDLGLAMLRPLFHRPGGKKAQSRNDSRRLFDLRKDIVEAIYHARTEKTPPRASTVHGSDKISDPIDRPSRFPSERFWAEIHITARFHWDAACEADNCPNGLLYEGWSKKKNEGYLTAAGWVRQVARFVHYCHLVGGYAMSDFAPPYRPGCDLLDPYFGPDSGIDSHAKRFAFILRHLVRKAAPGAG